MNRASGVVSYIAALRGHHFLMASIMGLRNNGCVASDALPRVYLITAVLRCRILEMKTGGPYLSKEAVS